MVRARFRLLEAGLLMVLLPVAMAHAADVTCYVDSVAGNDAKSGLSEDEARQSWSNIPSTCTIVKYKRGSVFNLADGDTVYPPKVATDGGTGYVTSKINTLTNYGDASLPLPKFIKTRRFGSGAMISAYQGNLTIDGLYLEGSESSQQMSSLAQGIAIMAGANTKILNNEITNCDIGMMLSGTGSLVQGNYVHDLHVVVDAPPGVDPNVVGGAEGIFVNASNNEVAYNTFIDCSDYAEWTGGDCDGGATEVTVPGGAGATVSGVKIHHNLSINSCGFFEVSSMGALVGVGGGISDAGSTAAKGLFADSAFYNNVIIDSGWLSLLQVNNTDLKNIRWENNTLVQHPGSVNAGIIAVVFTATSSGMSGGALMPNTVYWTNNIFAFDGVMVPTPDKNFVQENNIITKTDPGFVNFHSAATTAKATDFDLVAGSQAIDKATPLDDVTLDFLNRPVPDPTSGKPDIGAFEYNSTEATSAPPTFPGPTNPSHGNLIGQGGASGSGGAGGRTAPASGSGGATGSPGAGGSTTAAGTGGTAGSTVRMTGGAGGVPAGTGGGPGGSAGTAGVGASAQGGGGMAGSAGAGSGGAQGSGGEPTAGSTDTAGTSKSGCSCQVGRAQSTRGLWLVGVLGIAVLARRRQHGRR
jgi:MYXO-CTERM domain-containing protein